MVEPSVEQARDAFAARRIIEAGMLREAGQPLQKVIRRLREHIADEQRARSTAATPPRAPSCWPTSTSAWPTASATGC